MFLSSWRLTSYLLIHEYIGELCYVDRGDIPETTANLTYIIEKKLKGMSIKNTRGPDDITTELFVSARKIRVSELT